MHKRLLEGHLHIVKNLLVFSLRGKRLNNWNRMLYTKMLHLIEFWNHLFFLEVSAVNNLHVRFTCSRMSMQIVNASLFERSTFGKPLCCTSRRKIFHYLYGWHNIYFNPFLAYMYLKALSSQKCQHSAISKLMAK